MSNLIDPDFNRLWSLTNDAWVSPPQMAIMLNISVSRLAQLRSLGGGPPFTKRGNLIRYNIGKGKSWLADKEERQ